VTTRRLLPLLNLLGCLILTGIAITQWLKEHELRHQLFTRSQQLTASQEQLTTEKSKTAALESDILQLKDSITSLAAARQETEATLAKLTAERDAERAALATTADQAGATAQQTLQAQTAVWEKAIAQRDTKLQDLTTQLTATRQRLDQAITKLKQPPSAPRIR
jgi:chromosome segregation ATPase